MASTLAEFVAALKVGEVVPRPRNEVWKDMIPRIHVEGRIAEIDEEAFDWYFECLPPFHITNFGGFAFAEGAEPIRYFWRDQRSKLYYVRQCSWAETCEYCRLAEIPVPS